MDTPKVTQDQKEIALGMILDAAWKSRHEWYAGDRNKYYVVYMELSRMAVDTGILTYAEIDMGVRDQDFYGKDGESS